MISGRRRSVIFFTVLGICLVALAVTLNISWMVLNWGRTVLAILGVVFFLLIIAGMVLNTIFLVREIRRNEQHDSFINAVTHELKTPVASIRLYLQTLQARELDDGKRQEFYGIMLEDSDRLLHTIDQVLRAGSAGSSLRRRLKTRVDLADLARESVALARTRFRLDSDALAYEERLSGHKPIVLGDPDELQAAVWNLIDNAVKYSQSDVRVRVRLEDDGDQLAVRVLDRGIGISPGELKRVFRRFYRIPSAVAVRARGSSGLGLFIVRSVARRHGGRAFAQSEGAGQGGTVHDAASQGDRRMSAAARRVLIVEDEQHLAEGLRFNLEAEGYDAEVVDSGEAALEELSGPDARRFDLVVLDVMLPGKDGFAVVTELRAARQFVPILMLTARGRPEDVLRGFGAGADDYLPKPTELAILLARIKGLLRRSDWSRRSQDRYAFAGKTIDFQALELRVGARTLPLTLMEANLLRYLVDHEGRAVSRKAMLEDVWGVREDTDTRAIDNFIVRLRKYIETEPSSPEHVLTVRGVGYRFVAEPREIPKP